MSTVPQRDRQHRALTRLEAQLEAGTKVNKEGETVQLSEKDTVRINREIKNLRAKL